MDFVKAFKSDFKDLRAQYNDLHKDHSKLMKDINNNALLAEVTNLNDQYTQLKENVERQTAKITDDVAISKITLQTNSEEINSIRNELTQLKNSTTSFQTSSAEIATNSIL